MIELYETSYCPYCDLVKDRLEALSLEYKTVLVPFPHHERTMVKELSGQSLVPIIVDGREVINDSRRIIQYLNEKYFKN